MKILWSCQDVWDEGGSEGGKGFFSWGCREPLRPCIESRWKSAAPHWKAGTA